MSTCNWLDLETLGSWPILLKNLPRHCRREGRKRKVSFPLTPNVLCDHDLVANNSLWPLWQKFGWFLDCFQLFFFCMFRIVMSYYVDNFAPPLSQNAKLPENSQNNGFKICELIWVGAFPLFWNRVTLCHLTKCYPNDLSGGSIENSKLLPLKTTLHILILFSYIIELQRLKFGLKVVTSNLKHLHNWICQKALDLQLWSLKLKSCLGVKVMTLFN